jgi:hypothetical protein
MKSVLQQYYPNAIVMSTLQHNVCDKVREEGGDGDHTIWATSLCSDEVTNSFHYFTQKMAGPGPFILGGITGLPFAGVTGMKAFLSHVPTGGKAMIVYGPHIGVTQEGELGKVHRKNRDGHSTCCGSITAAVDSIRVHASGVQDDPLDYQQSRVIEHLNAHREDILAADHPVKVATDRAFEAIEQKLERILDQALPDFPGIQVVLVGGIEINTDWDQEDYFDLRTYRWIES